jgi:hypothetical protein
LSIPGVASSFMTFLAHQRLNLTSPRSFGLEAYCLWDSMIATT